MGIFSYKERLMKKYFHTNLDLHNADKMALSDFSAFPVIPRVGEIIELSTDSHLQLQVCRVTYKNNLDDYYVSIECHLSPVWQARSLRQLPTAKASGLVVPILSNI